MEKNIVENAEQTVLENSLTGHSSRADILESCREIVKELKVDWDTTISENFNPLHLALKLNTNSNLNTEFRDMSHKLEFFLDRVITSNFQGFSESLNSFSSFRNKNKQILEALDKCGSNAADIRRWSFNKANLGIEKENIEHAKGKYEICKRIMEAKNHYKMYQNTDDLIRKSVLINQCLDFLNDRNLLQIKGVFEYLKIVKVSFRETVDAINQKLFDFIFRNEIDNLFYFKAVMNLGSIAQLDEYFRQHFDRNVFGEIEKVIMRRYKTALPSSLSDPLLELESLSSEVCKKVESIIENMGIVVQRCSRAFTVNHEEDFFGAKKDKEYFVMAMGPALDCIKQNLKKFIERYSKEEIELVDKVDVYDDVDDTDYSQAYRNSPIHDRLQQTSDASSFTKKHFTVITAPSDQVVGCVLNNIRNTQLRSFVRQLAEGSYFSSLSVEKNMFRVDSIFRGCWMDVNPSTGKTNLLTEIRDIIRSCRSIEEERRIKGYVRKKLFVGLADEYNKMFTSELVKKSRCSRIVEDFQEKTGVSSDNHRDNRVRIGILPKDGKNNGKSKNNGAQSNASYQDNSENSESSVQESLGSGGNTVSASPSVRRNTLDASTPGTNANGNQLPGRSFLPKDYELSSYVVPFDEFKEMLITNHIDKNSLFECSQKYSRVASLIKTLESLDCFINSSEIRFMRELYSESLRNQALLDCFYYFDLLYRQGNYNFYMRKMAEALKTVYQESGPKYLERLEEALEYYCVRNVYSINVKNRKELDNFVANLEILGEILGEVGLSFKFEDMLRFFKEGRTVKKFGDKYTKILMQKIS